MATLSIKASTAFTGEVMDFVQGELEQHGFPATLQPDILIAVEEIFVNISTYAYQPAEDGDVRLSVSINGKAVIRFEDSGKPFNPLKSAGPNLDAPVMEREIGGLGIHFVKNMMDKVKYRYADKKNIITITKNIPDPDKVK